MLELIRIVKADGWKLVFDGRTFDISSEDSKIMDLLKPSNNQTCIITDVTSDNAVCYIVKTESEVRVYSYPDNVLRITSSSNMNFFKKLSVGIPYYLIPIK